MSSTLCKKVFSRDSELDGAPEPHLFADSHYGQDVFGRADFDQLADQLAGIKGRFILSINDTPGARATFARFNVSTAETTYTIGAGAAEKAGELIVSNLAI